MTGTPAAIGYLRRDVSKSRQEWDETQLRSLAKRLGYNLRKTIAFGEHTDKPDCRLRTIVARLGVEAVIVPDVRHFEGGAVPAQLVAVVDVITVSPECTYARWADGKLPELSEGAP
ncbi:hypothetical protein [Nocardia mexicana]|uniref:Resolvase-like protein n=1 Tax=Nocardia mexicana TaxID=279262 RepID=A0A370H542_9NOCA|nr:hypothetical protein [Nocardia mexicana]RDI51054.1 hypothetical protein DFR68_105531 [Nocardia mexicana]